MLKHGASDGNTRVAHKVDPCLVADYVTDSVTIVVVQIHTCGVCVCVCVHCMCVCVCVHCMCVCVCVQVHVCHMISVCHASLSD